MKYSVTFDEPTRITVIKYSGMADASDIEEAACEAARYAQTHQCKKVLIDVSDMQWTLSTKNIYDLPKSMAKAMREKGIELGTFKRALVVSTQSGEADFLETVSVNVGQQVKVFDDVDKARAWLAND